MRNNWTKEQEDELILLIGQGKTNEQIARHLGRTKSAVAHKRARLFNEALAPEVPADITADETEEDPDGEGETEIERELSYVQELLDEAVKAINANADILENNMAAMMERTNELSKEKTAMKDRLAEAEKELSQAHSDLNEVMDYLGHGPVWRMFHSFRKYLEGRQNG